MNRRFSPLLRRFNPSITATLILAVAATSMPAAALENPVPSVAEPSALRQSIDRAVESASTEAQADVAPVALTIEERADLSVRARRLHSDPIAGQASGGGKGHLILGVLGLAVSAATTYYYFKFMKDQQKREEGR